MSSPNRRLLCLDTPLTLIVAGSPRRDDGCGTLIIGRATPFFDGALSMLTKDILLFSFL